MLFIILLTFLNSLVYAREINFEKLLFLDGCVTFTMKRERSILPGESCIILPDARIISAGSKSLQLLKADKSIEWKVSGNFKKINKGVDRILAITPEGIQVYSPEGKLLHEKAGFFTSVYEIPENKLSGLPSHRPGNIIANGSEGIIIFSPDLAHVHYQKKLNSSHNIHDVQVKNSGEFLYFNSWASKEEESPYSAIEEFHPVRDRVTFSFTADPRPVFFSPNGGAVQELNPDVLFFNDSFHGGWFYSRKEKKFLNTVLGKYHYPLWTEMTSKITVYEKAGP